MVLQRVSSIQMAKLWMNSLSKRGISGGGETCVDYRAPVSGQEYPAPEQNPMRLASPCHSGTGRFPSVAECFPGLRRTPFSHRRAPSVQDSIAIRGSKTGAGWRTIRR